MKTEIEAKFLNVDFDKMRARLEELGAVCEQPMRLMRRALIRTPGMTENGRDAFIRLRDEANKVTLTYKSFDSEASLTGAKEIEIVVSDYDDTLAIFAQADLHSQSYQESRRETWRHENVEIVLDEWPWLNPYIEIEADSEQAVRDMADRLGFSWENAVFGSVDMAFKLQYPHLEGRGVIDVPIVTFEAPLPDNFKV